MKYAAAILLALVFGSSPWAWAADGLITVKSSHSAKATMDRLEKIVNEKGLTVFLSHRSCRRSREDRQETARHRVAHLR